MRVAILNQALRRFGDSVFFAVALTGAAVGTVAITFVVLGPPAAALATATIGVFFIYLTIDMLTDPGFLQSIGNFFKEGGATGAANFLYKFIEFGTDKGTESLDEVIDMIAKTLDNTREGSSLVAALGEAIADGLVNSASAQQLGRDAETFAENPKNQTQAQEAAAETKPSPMPPATDGVALGNNQSPIFIPRENSVGTSNFFASWPPPSQSSLQSQTQKPPISTQSVSFFLPGQVVKSAGYTVVNGASLPNQWQWPDGRIGTIGNNYGVVTDVNTSTFTVRRTIGLVTDEVPVDVRSATSAPSSSLYNIVGARGLRSGNINSFAVEVTAPIPNQAATRSSGPISISTRNGTTLSAQVITAITTGISDGDTGAVPVARPKPQHGVPLGQPIPRGPSVY